MAVYAVTWNLNKERSNYDQARRDFLSKLEQYDYIKDADLESVRWISTASSASQVTADLKTKLDNNDGLFVSKIISGESAGWLSKAVWAWIGERL